MLNTLVWQLKSGAPLAVAGTGEEAVGVLTGLQSLVGGTLTGGGETPDVTLSTPQNGKAGFRYDELTRSFGYFLAPQESTEAQVLCWRNVLRLAAAAREMGGSKVILMHGCLLKTAGGEGIYLCGQSGMGKSTTAERWTAAGWSCPADDMVLLEYGGETVYAHPLPTWSRCQVSLEGENCNLEEAVPVKAILALNRDEKREEIREGEDYKYMTALYASCSLFQLGILKNIREAHRTLLIDAIKRCAGELYERFPHRIFYANLQSDIRDTLGTF